MKNSLIMVGLVTMSANLMALSNKVIDCRLVTSSTTECKPYSTKFIFTKKVENRSQDKNDPIITKTAPIPRPKKIKMVTVADMYEQEIEVLEPIRYHGTTTKTQQFVKKVPHVEEINLTIVTKDPEELAKEQELEERANMIKKFPLYRVDSGDSLIVLSRRFGISVADIVEWNEIEDKSNIAIGDTLVIPITKAKFVRKIYAYKLLKERLERKAKEKLAKEKLENLEKKRLARQLYPTKDARNKYQINPKLKGRSLRVQATAYTSHASQTDGSPFLGAWSNRMKPGSKIIAVSRDLIRQHGLTNGAKVKISGLPGYYTVRDKMNSRYSKKIDIYMGLDRRRALSWGRRSVVITW